MTSLVSIQEKVTAPVLELEVCDPQDGRVVATVPRASRADVDTALSKAVAAQGVARAMSALRRATVLHTAAALVGKRREHFARLIAQEGIKTIREARKEVSRCAQTLLFCAEEARRLTGETIPFDRQPDGQNRVGYFSREPVGVVVGITPFNDPLNLVAHKVGPAIAAGNVVLVKPHEETPLSALMLARAFLDAGLPEDVLQVLVGSGSDVGMPLVTDRRVRMVSFTGGRETGETILRSVGVKKVSMELGGNCPTIVLDDADLNRAIPDCVSGAFAAAGQNCLHVQRLLIQDKVYEEFAARFIAAAQTCKMGDKMDETTDMGPLINEAAVIRVQTAVREAREAGAKLRTGGWDQGNFYAPTVLEGANPSTSVYHQEIFGPVTMLERIATLEEGIERANSVDFGLQSAVFTRDLDSAFTAVRRLECGMVIINGSTDYRDDAMPFGGVKGSGIGREGVSFAVREMSEPKVACFNL